MAKLFEIRLEDDLSEFDDTETGSGRLRQAAVAGLAGTRGGMQVDVEDTTALYGQVDSAAPGSNRMRARVYIDPNGISMSNGAYLHFLSNNGASCLGLYLRYETATGYYIRAYGVDDEDVYDKYVDSSAVSDGSHYVEAYVQRESAAGEGDGVLRLWVDGTLQGAVTTVDNYTVFGSVTGWLLGVGDVSGTVLGSFFLDELEVHDQNAEIGPYVHPGASSATLNGLRDRVRSAVESASGLTEPLIVTASSIQLATGTPNLRDRVESRLQDSGNTRWSTDDLDEAIRTALDEYSQKQPHHAIGTIALAAAGREISLSSLTGLLRVEKVWWDYDSSTPGYPPNWRQFEVWPGSLLYIDDREQPASGEVVRVWYTKMHTIKGLDSATATTVPSEDVSTIVTGAAYHAARTRALELSEKLNVDGNVVRRLNDWADDEGRTWRYQMGQKPPAWQRRASAYQQGDIDEAIRWALQRYAEVDPRRVIASLTLSASGREVDISSLSYLEVLRAWWDYDSSDPVYPPEWRDFEVWPGGILFVKDGSEPASGDVVRVWYTTTHLLNGLDSALSTTLPLGADVLIVTGASGYVTQERVQEDPSRYVPRKLREWAEARLTEFERGLRAVARRTAARESGIAEMPAIDRWDQGEGW